MLQTIPRTVVRTYLHLARLPLTAAEAILNREGEETWAPAVAFEAVEANVLQLAGSLLKDQKLTEEGRLVQAKVARLREAVELETEAEQKRAEADAEFRQRREADERRRQQVEAEATRREAELAQEKARKQRAAEEKAAKKAESVRKVETAQQQAIARQERSARATRVAAEQDALAEERNALEAREEVIELDRALQQTKAARKSR